jgi:cell fate regulator YaaT (PSP1 superfamily)
MTEVKEDKTTYENYLPCGHLRGLCPRSVGPQNAPLNEYDYLADVPGNNETTQIVEVQFKNTRKGFYVNSNNLTLVKGDMVAVEASPGHDIGTVTLTGRLAALQMKKANLRAGEEPKRVYRKVRDVDMEKYHEAKAREHETMIKSRQIAKSLGLQMKIGDVEYQGDGNKAIFYYIADQRVDFRQLIKVLAEEFHVRIEMKQIGARQEAGRIGGTGPCGRELCCATWKTSFDSVSTGVARLQNISLNPQKLAGQCAKLKCCLNYEVNTYVEALKKMPGRDVVLETISGSFSLFKSDPLAGLVTYTTDRATAANLVTIPASRAFEIIAMNKRGEKPDRLDEDKTSAAPVLTDLAEQDSLTRFDKAKRKKKRNNKNRGGRDRGPAGRGGNRQGQGDKQERGDRQDRGERKNAAPAARNNAAPARNNAAPARNNAAPARNNAAPARNNGAPARNNAAPAARNNAAPAAHNNAAPAARNNGEKTT